MASVSTNPVFIPGVSARQRVAAICVELSLQNFLDRSNVIDFDAPQNSVLMSGDIVVITAFDSATTDTISVGDDSSATRYLGATTTKATGRTALVPTGYKVDGHSPAFRLTRAQSGTAATTGLLRFSATYLTQNKTDWTEGVY